MNDELQQMYEQDVHEHAQGYRLGTSEYVAMRERDQQRRQRTQQLMEANALTEALDYFHAARLFQHGDIPDDAWTAHQLALKALELGELRARWYAAAAYDRWCMYRGVPQKFGTQFVPDGRRHRLWDVEPATTDADRVAWDVPPLAEQLRRAEEATRADPPQPISDDAPQWLKDAITRWQQQGS